MENNYHVIDGQKYDRVTSILGIIHDHKLEGFQRAKGFDYVDDVYEAAAERGKIFHSAMRLKAQDLFTGMLAESFKDSEMYDDIQLGLKWFDENVKEVIACEKIYYDSKLMFAGTVDLIARLQDDKIYLIDWKTGSVLSPKFRLQMGGYCHLAENSLDVKIQKRLIIQVHDGKLKLFPVKTDKGIDKNLFLYAHFLYKELING